MGDEEEQSAAGEEKGGTDVGYGKVKVHIAERQMPMVGMMFSGIIFLISVCVLPKTAKYWAYGVALGSVTIAFALIGVLLAIKKEINDKVGMWNCYFLFLWCFIGACIFTFSGPARFQTTSNGYFSAWGMAVFSIMSLGVTANQMTGTVSGMGSLLGLFACSVIVLIASIDEVQVKGSTYWNEAIFALVLSCATLCVAGGFWFKDRNKEEGGKDWIKFFVLGFFAICWICEACFVTFRGPFVSTGNGYFGSWGGAVTSVFATMGALS